MITIKQKMMFEVENAEIIDEEPSSQFATARIFAFSTGKSLHDTTCDVEDLKRTAPTIYEKPIIFEYDSRLRDFGGHSTHPIISGFIVQDSLEFFERPDGRTSFSVFAKIWKMYAPKFMDVFSDTNTKNKSVSVEIEINKSEQLSNGLLKLIDWAYSAVCVLGEFVSPASPDAEIQMLSFAKDNNEKYQEAYSKEFSRYADIDFNIPQSVKNNAKKALESYNETKDYMPTQALAMARFLSNNTTITPERVRAINRFFNKKNFDDTNETLMGLYGGSAAKNWCYETCNSLDEIDDRMVSYYEKKEGDFMPYQSLKDANPAIKGIDPPVSLAQANAIAKQADAVGTSDKVNGWAVAISSFKKTHMVKEGHWIAKESMSAEEFSKEDLGKGSALKVNKSKESMSESAWGNVDKTALRNKILEASNYKSLVKDAYMIVEAGWEDAPSSHLKYPVMELKGDTLVYNHYGLSAALQRAEGQNETGVVSKVHGIYKKMGLETPSTEKKKFSQAMFSLTSAQCLEIFNAAVSQYTYGADCYRKYWVEAYDEECVYLHDNEADCTYCASYTFDSIGNTAEVDVDNMHPAIHGGYIATNNYEGMEEYMADKKKPVEGSPEEEKTETPEEEKKEDMSAKMQDEMSDDKMMADKEGSPAEEKKESPDEEKKEDMGKDSAVYSLNEYLDVSALLGFLKNETAQYREMKDLDAVNFAINAIMGEIAKGKNASLKTVTTGMITHLQAASKIMANALKENKKFSEENKALKEFKFTVETERKDYEVKMVLKEAFEAGMPQAQIDLCEADAKNFSLENIDQYKNAVKAKAFQYFGQRKQNEDDGIIIMAFPFNEKKNAEPSLWK